MKILKIKPSEDLLIPKGFDFNIPTFLELTIETSWGFATKTIKAYPLTKAYLHTTIAFANQIGEEFDMSTCEQLTNYCRINYRTTKQ
jgi:hypothetical protein